MATTRYVSAAGNDSTGAGTQGLPYKTYAKAFSLSASGDTVKGLGGDVFREQVLGKTGVSLGAYGNGQAVISGADPFTGWTLAGVGTNTYQVPMSTQTNIVFVDDARAIQGASNSTLTNGQWFWVGGVCYYRSDAGNPDTVGNVIEAGQRAASIDTNNANSFTIDSIICQRSNADEAGLYAHFQTSGVTLTNFVSQDHFGAGIHENGTATNWTMNGIVLQRNGRQGLYQSHPSNTGHTILNFQFLGNGWRAGQTNGFCSGAHVQMVGGEIGFGLIDGNGSGGDTGGHEHGIYLNQQVDGGPLVHDIVSQNQTKGYGFKSRSGFTGKGLTSLNNAWGNFDIEGNGAANINVVLSKCTGANSATAGGAGIFGQKDTGTISLKVYHYTGYNNSAAGNGGEIDIANDLGAAIDLRNNILDASNKYIQLATQTGSVTIDYNDYFGYADSNSPFVAAGTHKNFAAWKALGYDAHSLNADPKFVNPATASFLLQQSSPAINAGIAISGINDGYSGLAPDMGAVEFIGATPNVQDLLLEKSDGSYWLLLWNRATSWNAGSRADVTSAPVSVSVATTATHNWTLYTPSTSSTGTVIGSGVTSVTVSVPDELIILKIS